MDTSSPLNPVLSFSIVLLLFSYLKYEISYINIQFLNARDRDAKLTLYVFFLSVYDIEEFLHDSLVDEASAIVIDEELHRILNQLEEEIEWGKHSPD